MSLQAARILILLLALFCISLVAYGDPDTDVQFQQCGQDTYPDGDPFGDAVNRVLNVVVTLAPASPGYDYTATVNVNGEGTVMARGICTTSLTEDDCTACLQAASGDVTDFCSGHKLGGVILGDCLIAYGQP